MQVTPVEGQAASRPLRACPGCSTRVGDWIARSRSQFCKFSILTPCRAALTMVDVAQLVEPRIVAPVVVGSNPIVHPI